MDEEGKTILNVMDEVLQDEHIILQGDPNRDVDEERELIWYIVDMIWESK